MSEQAMTIMPTAFVGHGAPTLAVDRLKGADLKRWGQSMPVPRAVLMVSAHWEATPVTLGSVAARPLVYDFYGFPPALYQIQYPAPGAPELADRVAALLEPEPVARSDRGLDHGVWVPALHLWPKANVPILQLSIPTHSGPTLFELGRRLAPLRKEGILIMGSGNLVHNLRALDFQGGSSASPSWASEFDAWCTEALSTQSWDTLIDYAASAPGLRLAHPTVEHLVPLLVAAGAASDSQPAVSFPVQGFEYGSISRRSVQLG